MTTDPKEMTNEELSHAVLIAEASMGHYTELGALAIEAAKRLRALPATGAIHQGAGTPISVICDSLALCRDALAQARADCQALRKQAEEMQVKIGKDKDQMDALRADCQAAREERDSIWGKLEDAIRCNTVLRDEAGVP
jgi:chromosome segregation ATPase